MGDEQRSIIVVGVDGSEASIEALRWATRQAEQTEAALRVVTAWTFPDEPTPFGVVPELPPQPGQLEEVESKLNEVIARTIPSAQRPEVNLEVTPGHAAAVLIEASRDADLLVVGNRGRGAAAELLLGSVSERCVRHASCPVVVVRGARSATARG
jgi:nucleotide-binding universal stress UspA family protein